jgi:hypothetical protein
MTSSIPQSALNAVKPPSVVIAMIGQLTPVESRSFAKDLTFGALAHLGNPENARGVEDTRKPPPTSGQRG